MSRLRLSPRGLERAGASEELAPAIVPTKEGKVRVLVDGSKRRAWEAAFKRAKNVTIRYSRPLHSWIAVSDSSITSYIVNVHKREGRAHLSCQCAGYVHGSLCKHIAAVAMRVSRWREVDLTS